jgi:hypothetical protein
MHVDRFYLAFFSRAPKPQSKTIFFSVDHSLLYNNFHDDFGPFQVAHVFRFAKSLHDILGVPFPNIAWSHSNDRRMKKQTTKSLFSTAPMTQNQDQTPHSSSLHT